MLLYTKELVAPPAQVRPGLQRFKPRPLLRQKYGRMLRQYFASSTIHGMQNLFAEEHPSARYFWLFVVLLATVSFLIMFGIMEQHHSEHQLVSVVKTTQLPVFNIRFPAVAICCRNYVNWLRASTAAERFLPNNEDPYVRETFEQLLIVMEQMTFGKFESMGALSKRNLTALAHLSLMKLAGYLAYRCNELFETNSCVFDDTRLDCCQLFVPERTENGQCLVFNSLISEESRKKGLINEFYPYKLSSAGQGTGLQFVLHSSIRSGNRWPFSINLMIKEPDQWSNPIIYHLYSNTENFVSIDPMMIQTSKNTYNMDPIRRRCYFDSERHPHFPYTELRYSRANCIAACLQRSVHHYCNCTMPLYLPSIDGTRECSVLDFPCLYKYTDVFNYTKTHGQEKYINDSRRGLYCKCPQSCNRLVYSTYLNVRQVISQNSSGRISADIYYGQRVLTNIETRTKFELRDWVANFGGILGLYLGASALSFLELAHVLGRVLLSLLKDLSIKLKH